MYPLLADAVFFQGLRELDYDLFREAKARGCCRCGGRLDTSNYPRKPRGAGEQELLRFSLCCRREGCRARLTPPSLRFFGRKIYPAWVVILAVEFCRELGLTCRIARQTITRWRRFWRERMSETHEFMRRARAVLPPGTPSCSLPSGWLPLMGFPASGAWVTVLRFFRDAAL